MENKSKCTKEGNGSALIRFTVGRTGVMNKDMKNDSSADSTLAGIAQAVTDEEASDAELQQELTEWQVTIGDGFEKILQEKLTSS